MEVKLAILVTDARQKYIGDYLPGRKQVYDWECEACQRILGEIDAVVLPTPVKKLENYGINDKLKNDLTKCKALCAGVIDREWKEWIKKRDGIWLDFMEQECVVEDNAWITAEATVGELLAHSKYSIRGQKVMIAGFGHCGKALAALLLRMGAKVTVLARSVEARKEARDMGCNAVDFSYAPVEAYGTGALINTVPATVIRENVLLELQKDAVVIDIASAPGGVEAEAARKCQLMVIQALGLPGIYTVKSSAKVLATSIRKKLLPQYHVDEGKLWTFQIIL